MILYELSKKQASLAFLLGKVYKDLFPGRTLIIEHSFGDGLYCHDNNWEEISEDVVKRLDTAIREIIQSRNIQHEVESRASFLEYLYKKNDQAKIEIIKKWSGDKIPIIALDGYRDIRIEPIEKNMPRLLPFQLRSYRAGILLRIPTPLSPESVPSFQDRPKLFSVIEEHEQWGSILNVSTIHELNNTIRNGKIQELMWVAEGFHENKISLIANSIVQEFPEKRIICVAGPTSSGKTTFAKRLRIQFRVHGFQTSLISMDDYFIDRDDLPKDPQGKQDFESIAALNTALLCGRLEKLLSGEPIPHRKFDFETGRGVDLDEKITLGEWDLVLLEGIHGLNPAFSEKFGHDHMARIYISAITQLNIDDHHRMSTSDNRLLRRIVRDYKYRGYSPEETLEQWPNVRLGEENNIFPFQDKADYMFNSSLVYELPAIAKILKPVMEEMSESEAQRLFTLMSFFEEVDKEHVPGISILREFIGGSEFHY